MTFVDCFFLFNQHPGVATISTSVASPGQLPPQLPQGPVATPVVASMSSATPPPQGPVVTTQVSVSMFYNSFLKCINGYNGC